LQEFLERTHVVRIADRFDVAGVEAEGRVGPAKDFVDAVRGGGGQVAGVDVTFDGAQRAFASCACVRHDRGLAVLILDPLGARGHRAVMVARVPGELGDRVRSRSRGSRSKHSG
jgi:hypothetical protein